jgi:hypothetical protein
VIALENLDYTLVQVVHNFGAAAIVGGSVFALYPATQVVAVQRKLAWLVGAGWAIQALSGMGFAAVSYYFYGKLPDIHGIALAALLNKAPRRKQRGINCALKIRWPSASLRPKGRGIKPAEIKMLCALGGFSIAVLYLRHAAGWTAEQRRAAWRRLIALGVTALAAAAFLRWFA